MTFDFCNPSRCVWRDRIIDFFYRNQRGLSDSCKLKKILLPMDTLQFRVREVGLLEIRGSGGHILGCQSFK